jgi:hypothetical protein
MKLALLIGGALLGLSLILVLIQLAVSRWARRRAKLIQERHYADLDILRADPLANGLGRRSRGLSQLRGNGLLILTPEQLIFHPLVGGEPYAISLDSILAVEGPKVHLGKTRFRPLLALRYRSSEEEVDEDLVAWDLRDREAWVEAIEKARPDTAPSSNLPS